MKGFPYLLIFILAGVYVLSRCASIKPPTGGPMDTIPPILVRSIPENKSLNYKGKSVRLVFDEYLKIQDLTKQLIVTPLIESDYESKIRKNSIDLTFPEPFDDSTTYTFNFQTAIQDITEGNVTEDNVLAFSTGDYIDSISVNGKIRDLFTNEPVEDYNVCLYNAADTLHIFNSKPLYLTRTNEEGVYQIENIKNGYYRMYAYNDINSNLICDIPREKFGFDGDTLDLTRNIDSLMLNVYYLDLRPLEIQREGPAGLYYEIKLNKNIVGYEVKVPDTTLTVYHNFGEEKSTVRFYDTFQDMDSILYYFSAQDSLDQKVHDTLYIKFTESKRKKIDYTYAFKPKDKENVTDDFNGQITFNKPSFFIPRDSIYFKYDSITYQFIPPDSIRAANERKDKYQFEIDLFLTEYLENISRSDTVVLQVRRDRQADGPGLNASSKKQQSVNLRFERGSFVSAEQDTLPELNFQYSKLKSENYGIIRGRVMSDFSNFTIQLLDKQGFMVLQEIHSKSEYSFNHVKPGEYRIRVFIDNNNDGKWDPGNVFELKEPEDVYFLDELISVRANWEITDIILEF
ncbi:MAG: Ig-like domain-containing protein [Cyclobacteriaceae bacterium]|nr:Ig-like domain-containing protein [Cyclobacteriaceae bacterium]